jgi:phosphoribosyl 1,2-cyclic phosphate phosphodiesterase
MTHQAIFLGTGSSSGVPVLGCSCNICHSNHSKNKRLRSSILLQAGQKNILFDAAPDFRATAIDHDIGFIDTCFISHMHFDHCGGVDDFRSLYFFNEKKIKVVMLETMKQNFLRRYDYIKQHCEFEFLPGSCGHYSVDGLSVRYFSYSHANMQVMGLRYKNFAYLTDIKEYDDSLFQELIGLDTLVIAATRVTESPLHLSLAEAIKFAKRSGAMRVYFTHLSHEICYELHSKGLPEGMSLAYDGLTVPI